MKNGDACSVYTFYVDTYYSFNHANLVNSVLWCFSSNIIFRWNFVKLFFIKIFALYEGASNKKYFSLKTQNLNNDRFCFFDF